MAGKLKIAWISEFPFEWLDDFPDDLQKVPRQHPLTWQRTLLKEFENCPSIEIHVIALRRHLKKSITLQRKGVTFHLLRTPPVLRAGSLFWVDTLIIRALLKKINPAAVHAWGIERGAAVVAQRLEFPSVITMQGILSSIQSTVPLSFYFRLITLLEKQVLSRPAIVTAESAFAVSYLTRKYPKITVSQIEHAPDPIFHAIKRSPQIGIPRFVSIGRFGWAKGTDILLDALKQLQKDLGFHLTLIGTPEINFQNQLEEYLQSPLGERITFYESLGTEKIAEILTASTTMIFPSRAENSPNVVKEAVVAGVPVIGSDVGGIPDYVVPGKNGLLFPVGKVEGCIEAIREASRHLLFSKGQVDQQTLFEKRAYLSPSLMGEKFLKLYKSIISD